jgi:hypothetical protein
MRDETKWFASEIKDFFPTYYGEATDPFCITPAAVYVRVYNQRRRGRRWWRQRPCTWFWRLSRGLSGWPVLGRLYFFSRRCPATKGDNCKSGGKKTENA